MVHHLIHRQIGDLHVFTSPDLPGLYVAHPDEATARSQVPESIAAIERINAPRIARERAQQHQA